MAIKSITVYCSSSDKLRKTYYQDAEEIIKLISSFKINIVYGGAKVGIMGVVAKTAKTKKNKAFYSFPVFLNCFPNYRSPKLSVLCFHVTYSLILQSVPNYCFT